MAARNAAFVIKAEPVGDRRVKFIASTDGVDRHGTRLLPSGCRYENYLKNPVFLWNHRKHEEAEPDDVIGRAVSVRVTGRTVEIIVEFDTAPKADHCLQLVRRGMLQAVSVGFIPLVESPKFKSAEEAETFLARGGVVEVQEWELCELSLTIVPSNPDALKSRAFTLRVSRTPEKMQVAAMMVHRPDGATLWGKRRDSGLYTTPAGKLNSGETPEAGAARELFEESGLRAVKTRKLGVGETPRAIVHCFHVEVAADARATSANDPDKEVAEWEWRRSFPSATELHHKPNSLLPYYQTGAAPLKLSTEKRFLSNPGASTTMDSKLILEKLGIPADANQDAIVPALLKYLSGADSDADKSALLMGLLKMLVPATAAGDSATSEGAEEAAREAMMEEMKNLRSRNDALEGEVKELKARAEGEGEKPEEMADRAVKAGRWPDSARAKLVERYAAKQSVKLFEAGTFLNRSVRVTEGGAAKTPNFGSDAVRTKAKADVKDLFALTERNVANVTGSKRPSGQ
jgi:8-oxo-dGTP pyrophosphatase MutT (NUDIX family)